MTEDEVLYTVDVIDVADTGRRLYGSDEAMENVFGVEMPEHDYRFQITRGNGYQVTFNRFATAHDVVAYMKRHGDADAQAEPAGTEAGSVSS